MKRKIWLRSLLLAVLVVSMLPASWAGASGGTFKNPLKAGAADPFVTYKDGFYYMVYTQVDRVDILKSPSIQGLSYAPSYRAYPSSGTACCNIWAPELHFLNGKWYLYYTKDDGTDANHRMYVLENSSADPTTGSWTDKGQVAGMPNTFAIDATVLNNNGNLYFLWSSRNGVQEIWIAAMSNPWTITGTPVKIATPTYSWEIVGGGVNEAPEALIRNGKIFIVYSATGCQSDDYALGMLTASQSSNLLSTSSWTKSASPVFSKSTANGVYGPGHNSFVQSPDGSDWIVYHANSASGDGCTGARSTRAQKFTWDSSGNPVFGTPVSTSTAVAADANESKYEAEFAARNNSSVVSQGSASNGNVVGYIDYSDSWVQFNNVTVPTSGTYAVTVRFDNGSGSNSSHQVSVNSGSAFTVTYPNTGWGSFSNVTFDAYLNAGANTIRFTKGTNYAELDYIEIPRYEGEWANLTQVNVDSQSSASRGQVAGHIDYSGSKVEFVNVRVPSSGTYTLRIRYDNGSGSTATHNLSVNGGGSTTVSYPNTGWGTFSYVTSTVSLNAGSNTIALTKGTNYAEIDYIEVYK